MCQTIRLVTQWCEMAGGQHPSAMFVCWRQCAAHASECLEQSEFNPNAWLSVCDKADARAFDRALVPIYVNGPKAEVEKRREECHICHAIDNDHNGQEQVWKIAELSAKIHVYKETLDSVHPELIERVKVALERGDEEDIERPDVRQALVSLDDLIEARKTRREGIRIRAEFLSRKMYQDMLDESKQIFEAELPESLLFFGSTMNEAELHDFVPPKDFPEEPANFEGWLIDDLVEFSQDNVQN